MDKPKFFLRDEQIRANLKAYIDTLPLDDRAPLVVSFAPMTRTLDQNSRFHAICGDVAAQAIYMNQELKPVQWKTLFISGHAIATGLGAKVVPGLENEFVNIRESSAQMGVKRMSSLIEYTQAWCGGNSVTLRDVGYRGDFFGRAA
ncbi:MULTISPECIES: recombination protein NinB [unclassified Serratia (in: enterobacteria)]|uniref:recombination protein NinB n=1 Tax=unclassified Serratia (in: enterobacteria) TaxID=2647522 RepID=UPI000469E02D|nr:MULTISPECIES: recombination protein NinB [unclassified Serratia (in: enterobacteria)]